MEREDITGIEQGILHTGLTPAELQIAMTFAERNSLLQLLGTQHDAGGHMRFYEAEDVSVQFPNEVQDSVQHQEIAERLSERHNAMVLSQDMQMKDGTVVPGIFPQAEEFRRTGDRQQFMQYLHALHHRSAQHGFFLIRYTPQFVKQRIACRWCRVAGNERQDFGPSSIIAEVLGRYPTSASSEQTDQKPSIAQRADCQILLPPPGPSTKYGPLFRIPGDYDIVLNAPLQQLLAAQPWRVAKIDDVACEEDFQGLRLSATAISYALERLASLNALRGEHTIRHVVAEVATCTGVRFADGEILYFSDIGLPARFRNLPSHNFFGKFQSPVLQSGFEEVAVFRNIDVPLSVDQSPNDIRSTIVDWTQYAAQLRS